MGIKDALAERGIRGIRKRGQVYVDLPNEYGKLKIKEINPESYARAETDDKFSVAKERGENLWAEYFPSLEEMTDFVEQEIEKGPEEL